MRTIEVKFIGELTVINGHEDSGKMQLLQHYRLSNYPWNFSYHPDVFFYIAHDDAHLYLSSALRNNMCAVYFEN